jgi:hypothetical protein
MAGRELGDVLPEHVMRKQITADLAERLKLNDIPALNLNTFPISIKDHPQEKLLGFLVSLFSNMYPFP